MTTTSGRLVTAFLMTMPLAAVGCRKAGTTPEPSPGPAPAVSSTTPAKSAVWIKADPNPVLVDGEKGSTTISWDTGAGSMAQIYMTTEGKPPQLFAGGARGSQKVNWIRQARTYEFVLYAGTDRQKELARLTVIGQGASPGKKE
jgi:hypothetical protein